MGRRVNAEVDKAPLVDANRRRNAHLSLRLSKQGAGLYEAWWEVKREQPDLDHLEQWEVAIERLGLTEDYEFLVNGGSWRDLN